MRSRDFSDRGLIPRLLFIDAVRADAVQRTALMARRALAACGSTSLRLRVWWRADRPRSVEGVPTTRADVWDRVRTLPVSTWSYKWDDPRIVHIPMAQDFADAFGLGESVRTHAADANGVLLAACKRSATGSRT